MRLRANTKSPAALEMIRRSQERDKRVRELMESEGIDRESAYKRAFDEEGEK